MTSDIQDYEIIEDNLSLHAGFPVMQRDRQTGEVRMMEKMELGRRGIDHDETDKWQ